MWLNYLIHRRNTRARQNKETEEYIPNKRKRQTLRRRTKEMGTSLLPDKEFKVMAIKMLTKLERRMDKHCENLNKETENIIKYQS